MKTKNEYKYILKWHKKIKAIELLGGKCSKCNENRPWLLVFHHKNPNEKEFEISRFIDARWDKIQKEIIKCDLLCDRCHRELHNQNKNSIDNQSKKMLLEIKSIFGCEECGYNNYIGALDFHHIKNKLFDVGNFRLCENSCIDVKEKIEKEIDKCQVLCSNCHRNLHFDKEKFAKYKDEIYNRHYKEFKKPLNKELVINLYNSGMMQIDIAKKYERNKSVICGIIKRYKN